MWHVHPFGDKFFAAKSPHSIGLLFPSRDSAQAFCDGINAKCAFESRKNAALDFALAGGATDAELDAAMKTADMVGLLEFEARMCDSPVVVESV